MGGVLNMGIKARREDSKNNLLNKLKTEKAKICGRDYL
ncbi:MAG: hypothetical protein Pg6B_02460 [Candidatus Azobacteroides pseudotrichonymphae]|nr:MAG: hypothetical protein Pg6B_02460 [Candidatus Azobacteroides pseudotrichonymphae]